MAAGIVFLKTEFYPVEAVGFQDDGAAVPFAEEDVMDGRGEDKIAVGNKKEFWRIIGIVRDIGVPEHVGLSARFDDEVSGIPMKLKRRIFPEQRLGQEGQADGTGGLRCRPGQGKDTHNETEAEREEGEGAGERTEAGSHDGNFKISTKNYTLN